MQFIPTDEQRALQTGVREICDRAFPRERLHAIADGDAPAIDPTRWQQLRDAGVFDLRRPETEGGVGLGYPDAVLVFEELGRALVPGPLVATHLAAGRVEGSVVAVVERRSAPLLIEHLDSLDALVVLDDESAHAVEPTAVTGVAVNRPLDPLTPVFEVPNLPTGERVEASIDWRRDGALLTAAFQAGIATAVTELATTYAKQREQFGRVIGSFQAVKHLCADMLVRAELARVAVEAAGVICEQPEGEDPNRAVAVAKCVADDAAVRNVRSCVQVHGGMGFTWEADPHLYLKRAWLLAQTFGHADRQAETVAASL